MAGSFVWSRSEAGFGGFSGIEVSDDGAAFTAITDSGTLYRGRFLREDGIIAGVVVDDSGAMMDETGLPVSGERADAEGLAIGPDGTLFVSFENVHRVMSISEGDSATLPVPRDFEGLQRNSGLEALAIDAKRRLYAIPERSGMLQRPFPVYRHDPATGVWDVPFRIARSGDFLPTGADFGPDGRLYLLERSFHGIFGFSSRVRAIEPRAGGVLDGVTLIETARGQNDNLEGIAVWGDDGGAIRLTLISDDNFLPIQRTEIVEYLLLP